MEVYDIWLLITGLACLGAAWLPNLLHKKPVSFPIVYVGIGIAIFSLPINFTEPDPLVHEVFAERFTELVVIISLMGAGIKLDRPFSRRNWAGTWRLLGITMILSIAAVSWSAWWLLALSPAAAIMLGAALAPTDPVLASDVQVGPPMEENETNPRFTLTSEAGLNDGLAFPFTNLAVSIGMVGLSPDRWLGEWLLVDVLYKIGAGILMGYLSGRLLSFVLFRFPVQSRLSETGEGIVALAIVLISYSVTELVHGYGFIAVFISAYTLRHSERHHEYHLELYRFVEQIELLLMSLALILVGGLIASGIFVHLTWEAVVIGIVLILFIRPVTGLIGLTGLPMPGREKVAIAFLGIRGIGSFYYLAYGLHLADLEKRELLWALVTFVVLASIVLHGLTSLPIMRYAENKPAQRSRATEH